MARFLGGLNRDIQDILDYKDYNSITRLFHFATKAEREVHGHQPKQRGDFGGSFAGHTPAATSNKTAPPTPSNNSQRPSTSTTPSRALEINKGTGLAHTQSSSSVASTGRTRETQCHRYKGFGHMMRDYPSKRALLIKDNGEYTSASEI